MGMMKSMAVLIYFRSRSCSVAGREKGPGHLAVLVRAGSKQNPSSLAIDWVAIATLWLFPYSGRILKLVCFITLPSSYGQKYG